MIDLNAAEKKSTRDGFGEGLLELGSDTRIVALTADLAESTRCHLFAQKYPERFVEVGVAEQNLIGVAAGLAHMGKIPFACSFAVFSPGRSWDQIRVSGCYSAHNIKIVGSHAGLTVGEDGATHQALEDIAITRVLPNMVVLVPCDANQARNAVRAAVLHDGPVYLRTGRASVPVITSPDEPFVIGKATVLQEGTDVTIIACGVMVAEALLAAEQLTKQNISAEVINCASIKPFDEQTLLLSVRKTGCVVSAEEHQIIGGLGSAVAEVLAKTHPTPQEFVGMQDCFGQSGSADALLDYYGMRAKNIVSSAKAVLARKNLH